jgi:Domain of unknown function (DUF4191)
MALFSRSSKPAAGTGATKTRGRGATAAKPKQKRPRGARLKTVKTAFVATRKQDPKVLPLVLIAFFAPFLLLLSIGFLVGWEWYLGFLGLLVGLLAATFVFGRRVQATAYSQVEGQLGAAAAVLQNMRGDWRVTPAVGFTREQDLVHRVIGKPGVILVAEGARNRTRNLVGNEKRRVSRVAGQTPVYDVYVGDGEGEVPLRGLEKHFLKLPHNIKPKIVNELDRKFTAMGGPAMPIPKGPMPRGGRVPRR